MTDAEPRRRSPRCSSTREVVVFCGSGGVGKTSAAAAAALTAAARLGGKVLVLTIDPAKRLADALGLEAFGNVARRVPLDALRRARASSRAASCGRRCSTPSGRGTSSCCATRPTRRPRTASSTTGCTTTSPAASCRATTTSRWSGSTSSTPAATYDLIVIDTPPTRNAIDFLEAPARMAEFFGGRLLRWLTMPYRIGGGRGGRMFNAASRPFYQMADRVLGSQFLQDIAEFFLNFQSMYAGFVERAQSVEQLLHDRRTTFAVVTTLEGAPLREAETFCASSTRARLRPRRARAQQDAARLPAVARRRARGRRARARERRPSRASSRRRVTPALADPRRHRARAAHARRLVPQLRGRRAPRSRAAHRAHPSRAAGPRGRGQRAELRRPTSPTSRGLARIGEALFAHGRRRYDPPVTTFFEQARTKTALWGESLRHVQRLAASWQPLADLCFSDLLLLAPVVGEDGSRSVVLAQVRPTTGQTVYPMDLVGAVVDEVARPAGGAGLPHRRGRRGRRAAARLDASGRTCSASRCVTRASVVAVVTRETRPTLGRQPRRARAALPVDVRPLRGDDRRGQLPVPPGRRRVRGRPACRRRRHPPRPRPAGALRQPERGELDAPPRHPLVHVGPAPGGDGLRPGRGRRRHPRPAPGHRGDRAGRDVAAAAGDPAARGRPGRRRAACCCATSPTCAAATACCCRRTRPSARSTTG